jgi:hypothetical protein
VQLGLLEVVTRCVSRRGSWKRRTAARRRLASRRCGGLAGVSCFESVADCGMPAFAATGERGRSHQHALRVLEVGGIPQASAQCALRLKGRRVNLVAVCSFSCVDGTLYELDGRKKRPINHGPSSPDTVLQARELLRAPWDFEWGRLPGRQEVHGPRRRRDALHHLGAGEGGDRLTGCIDLLGPSVLSIHAVQLPPQ